MKILSIILPIKVTKINVYLIERLKIILDNSHENNKIEYIVVDSSKGKYQKKIEFLLTQYKNSKYVYFESNNIYSAAKARNFGVIHSSSEYILFYDVDLLVCNIFIENVLTDIKEIEKITNLFFIYPCLYLSQEYTRKISSFENINFQKIKESYLKGHTSKVLFLAVNTSTILVSKEHFIKIGMYDENFKGHGYEDFELIHRLYLNYVTYKIDEDYLIDFKTNFPAKYEGFRKYFAYISLPNFFRDMYTIHLWHPRPLSQKYYKVRKENQNYFVQKISLDLKKYKYNQNENLMSYDEFIANLLSGFDTNIYCGLYKYNDSVKHSKKSIKRKMRKLLLNPVQFFKDMRLK
jgi:predicted glycosyltransferase involved in capsule biosynthesis